MEDEPSNFNICPSCGTEFGYHDANVPITTLRAEWLRNGAKWWSATEPEPEGWDPYAQVSNLLSQRSVWQGLMIPAGNSTIESGLSRVGGLDVPLNRQKLLPDLAPQPDRPSLAALAEDGDQAAPPGADQRVPITGLLWSGAGQPQQPPQSALR